MNLYLRLLWLFIRMHWLPKQVDPLAASTLHMRVMPNDLDIYLHVNNGRYLTLMDLGRMHLIVVSGLLKPLRQHGFAPLLGSIKVHFIRSLRLFDKFTQTTQVVYWDEKWIYIEQKIFKDNELRVVALMKMLFVSKEGKVPPDKIIQLLPNPPTRPPMPLSVLHWQDAEKATKS